tara:strand:- start:63 stop:437 length:375 start_codon:yes stop_codon:yes gene_type:complete
MKLRLFFLSIAISTFLIIFILGCNITENTSSKSMPAENINHPIDILDFSFEDITISVGTTIIWTNRDSNVHTTTSGVPPKSDRLWGSQFLNESDQFSHTFNHTGVFYYWCKVHPFMTAAITVEN